MPDPERLAIMKHSLLLALRTIVSGLIGALVVAGALSAYFAVAPPLSSFDGEPLYAAVALFIGTGLSIGLAWFAARSVFRATAILPAGHPHSRFGARVAVFALLTGYAITAVFGVPAVQSHLTAEALAAYKAARHDRAGSGEVWPVHPVIRTKAAVPLLPGVIVSYHEYQVASLHGWGGWEVHVWFGGAPKSVYRLMAWIS